MPNGAIPVRAGFKPARTGMGAVANIREFWGMGLCGLAIEIQ